MSRNIIITVLSPLKSNVPEIVCPCDTAAWTNEACLKYLLRRSESFSDVICLCPDETDSDEYETLVRNIVCQNSAASPQVCRVACSSADDMGVICDKLVSGFRFAAGDTIYFDVSGGFQTAAYALIFLFRYFEYIGVKAAAAVYSSCQGKIEDMIGSFRMFTLINGVHEFTMTGSPRTLKAYFANTRSQTIISLLDAMKQFYDQISLCRIGEEFERSLSAMETALCQAKNLSSDHYDENLFYKLLPVIGQELFYNSKSRCLSLIKWCLNNELLQQAVNIYAEKIPKAYFTELGFFTAEEELVKRSAYSGTEVYAGYFITPVEDDFKKRVDEMIQERRILIGRTRYTRGLPLIKCEEDCEKLYSLVLSLRDTFYDKMGRRLAEMPDTKAAAKLLGQTFVRFEKLPTTIEKLLNSRNALIRFSNPSEDMPVSVLASVKKLKGVQQGLINEAVTAAISEKDCKELRLDYLYLQYIRDQISHAGEITRGDEKYKRYFAAIDPNRYIFPEDSHFSADDIRAFLSRSVARIEAVYEEKQKKVT